MFGANCWWGPGFFMGGYQGIIGGLLFWGLILLGIYFLVKYLIKQIPRNESYGKTALQILKERFARGEIDLEEYEKSKANLD